MLAVWLLGLVVWASRPGRGFGTAPSGPRVFGPRRRDSGSFGRRVFLAGVLAGLLERASIWHEWIGPAYLALGGLTRTNVADVRGVMM